MFGHLEAYAGDPILSLNEAFHKDPRSDKVNLSIEIGRASCRERV